MRKRGELDLGTTNSASTQTPAPRTSSPSQTNLLGQQSRHPSSFTRPDIEDFHSGCLVSTHDYPVALLFRSLSALQKFVEMPTIKLTGPLVRKIFGKKEFSLEPSLAVGVDTVRPFPKDTTVKTTSIVNEVTKTTKVSHLPSRRDSLLLTSLALVIHRLSQDS